MRDSRDRVTHLSIASIRLEKPVIIKSMYTFVLFSQCPLPRVEQLTNNASLSQLYCSHVIYNYLTVHRPTDQLHMNEEMFFVHRIIIYSLE